MGKPQRWREERREHAERRGAFEAGRIAGLREAAKVMKPFAFCLNGAGATGGDHAIVWLGPKAGRGCISAGEARALYDLLTLIEGEKP